MSTGAALALVGLIGLGWIAVLHRLLGDAEPQLRPDRLTPPPPPDLRPPPDLVLPEGWEWVPLVTPP